MASTHYFFAAVNAQLVRHHPSALHPNPLPPADGGRLRLPWRGSTAARLFWHSNQCEADGCFEGRSSSVPSPLEGEGQDEGSTGDGGLQKTEVNEDCNILTLTPIRTWYPAQEAKEAGFADTVLEPVKMAARFDPEKLKVFIHAPANVLAMARTETATPARSLATIAEAAYAPQSKPASKDQTKGRIVALAPAAPPSAAQGAAWDAKFQQFREKRYAK